MTNNTIIVSYDAFQNMLEQLLVDNDLIRHNEFLVYANIETMKLVSQDGLAIECQVEFEEANLSLTRDPPKVEVIEDEP